MMKIILGTFITTSTAWAVLFCVVAIRNITKQNELKRLVNHYKFNAEAMQQQFIQWRKQYEKMESGDTNADFLGSLDILHNNQQNGNGKTHAGTAHTVKQ
jgi:hypothetical protein